MFYYKNFGALDYKSARSVCWGNTWQQNLSRWAVLYNESTGAESSLALSATSFHLRFFSIDLHGQGSLR